MPCSILADEPCHAPEPRHERELGCHERRRSPRLVRRKVVATTMRSGPVLEAVSPEEVGRIVVRNWGRVLQTRKGLRGLAIRFLFRLRSGKRLPPKREGSPAL